MKSGQLVATFAAKRDSPPSSTSKAAGFYTVGLLPDAAQPDPSAPEGAGWAIARVNRNGRGSLVGRLADDTPISAGIVLSMEDRWVCYSQPDGPMGSILGEVTFDDAAENSDGSGVLDWLKAARPSAAFYPAGFSTRLSLVACRFVPSSERQSVLPFANAAGNARWVARGGGLPLPLQILLTIGRRGVARVLGPSAESLQIGLGSGAGIFAGGFIRPDVNRPASFRGVVLQKAGRAVGYFPGVRKTGFVGIEQSPTIPGAEGGGLNGDWTRPTLEITAPANGARIPEVKTSGGFGFPPPALLIQGIARHDSPIASVQFQRLHHGTVSDLFTASGTNNWIVALYLTAADAGENTVFVKTIDTNGNESPLSARTFTYVVMRDLLVSVDGMGEVTGGFLGKTPRELGKSYRIGATPSPGYRFTGWSGAVSSSSRIIEFTMAEGFSLQAHFVPVN